MSHKRQKEEERGEGILGTVLQETVLVEGGMHCMTIT